MVNEKIIFSYGVWDILHYGHIRLLKKAKALGDKIIIGVFTDKVAEGFKRIPCVNENDRFKLMEELDLGEVVFLNQMLPTDKFLIDNKISIVAKAKGAGWDKENIPTFKNARSILLSYTEGISSSLIIKNIKK